MTVPATTENKFATTDYRLLFRNHPAAVAIVTLGNAADPVGFTATSVVSASADPAVITFSIMETSSCWPRLSKAESVVLHFLGPSDIHLAQRFATSGVDRFANVEWSVLPTGEPVLSTQGTWVRGTVLGTQSVGSSHLVQVQPTDASIHAERSPLVYFSREYHELSELSVINSQLS